MTKQRILLVDDEESIRSFVSEALSTEGYEVSLAADGEEGLKALEEALPDLAILDIRMPKMDGVEVCRRVREWSQVPLVMLSAVGDEQNKIACLRLGADDFLAKPFGVRELLARVEAVLRRSSGEHPDMRGVGKLSHQLTDVIEMLKANGAQGPGGDNGNVASGRIHPGVLSVRQVQVLRLVAEGMSNKEIAADLGISEQTVKNHMTHIMENLSANDRSHAVVLAFRLGLLDLDGAQLA